MATSRAVLERDAELDLLTRLLDHVGTDGGRVVLIRGEAGIGKTALVREFVNHVREHAHALVGYCDDLLTARPLGPFWDMSRKEPSLAESLEALDRSRVMDTVLDLLSREIRPTVMVIEDIQWADEATLDVISYVGRRIEQTNGLLVLAFRDTEVDVDHPLRGVLGGLPPEHVIRIRLAGLSLTSVALLLEGSGLDAGEVMVSTDGNPFLVAEMAAVEGEIVPLSVQDSVMARVRKLSDSARALLSVMSVIPEWISREGLSQLRPDLNPGLEECERAGLLDIASDSVGYHHELTRRAVEVSLTETERTSMHRQVLECLPPSTDPARLVHHARGAGDIDRLIVEVPRAARAAASVGSMGEAADFFSQLASCVDRLDPDVKGLILEEWAWAEMLRPDFGEPSLPARLALEYYRQVGDRNGESRALGLQATLAEWQGDRKTAVRLGREAIDVLGPNPDGPELVKALEVNAFLAMMAGDASTTSDLVDRAFAAAGPETEEQVLVRCLVHKGIAANMAHYPDGKALLDEARMHAASIGAWREAVRALANHGELAAYFRDLDTAADYTSRAKDLMESHESAGPRGYEEAVLAMVLCLSGDWDQAEEMARKALTVSPKARGIVSLASLPSLGAIEARSGRPAARETLWIAWDMAVRMDEYPWTGATAGVLAEYAWITGDIDIPLEKIEEVMRTLIGVGWEWQAGLIALWLWKLGELSEVPKGIAQPYRLIMTGDAMAAAEIMEERGIPYERAIALSHGNSEARLKALGLLQDLGATAVADKLRQELREKGVSVPKRLGGGSRRAGLTARQMEVLGLLAEGLSNIEIADRLFLSPRTIEHHVAAVMSKLDASTRKEAVVNAAELRLVASA